MKAFLNRLGRGRDKDREKVLETPRPSEKPPAASVLPDLPAAFKTDDFFSDPSSLATSRASHNHHPSSSTTTPRASGTNKTSSTTNSSAYSRPPSQFELSLQKPLPEINSRQLPTITDRDERTKQREASQATAITATSTTVSSRPPRDPDSQGRSTFSKQSASTHLNSVSTDSTSITGGSSGGATATGGQQQPVAGGSKKVAFISPPPTPGGLSILAPLPDMVTDLSVEGDSGQQPTTPRSQHGHSHSLSKATSFTNAPSSTSARRSSTNLPAKNNASPKAGSSSKSGANPTSPTYANRNFAGTPAAGSSSQQPPRTQSRAEFAQSTVSFRSGTPYSHMSARSTTIQLPSSWSEAAEEDLVSNLGPRERTRQEVLWEIVTSEQRYVTDLIKLKETFIDPLLHPYATSPPPFSSNQDDSMYFRAGSPVESIEHLPIASRFLTSPTPDQPRAGNVAGVGAVGYSRQRTASEGTRAKDARSIGGSEEESDEKTDRMGSMSYVGGLKGVFKDRDRNRSSSSASGKPPTTGGRSPYGSSSSKSRGPPTSKSGGASRSHQSLPPPSRADAGAAAATSRQSLVEGMETLREGGATTTMSTRTLDKRYMTSPSSTAVGTSTTPTSRMFGTRKLHKQPALNLDGGAGMMMGIDGLAVPPHLLPEDLRICLEVLETSLKGHIALCDSLRERYEEQYPLVRSLADVFVANSQVLEGYANYVLHLERALEQVDNALLTPKTKRPKKQDAADWAKVCALLQRLEEIASDKGETGLAISLSKPFQRLLKYPLMFQNLLFHTDPSTFEYEATLQMVAGVERIVRSIEDEKIQKEERDMTRDIFARIEGLEKVKMLAVPKPSRMLIEEKQVSGADMSIPEGGKASSLSRSSRDGSPSLNHASSSASITIVPGKNVKTKASFKRLSDVLPNGAGGTRPGVGGKNDLWLVRFNDVVLRCQRTGTTTLPLATGLASASNSRSNSLTEFAGGAKAKYATTGRRHSQLKPRNLYKFVKIETWVIGNVAKPRVGMVSMEDIGRSRSGVVAIEAVKSGDTDDDNDGDSDDSDRKSKMSFSYWGADKITVDPVASAKARAAAQKTSSSSRRTSLAPVAYTRSESSAKAKFGSRMRNSEADDDVPFSLRSAAARKAGASSSASRRAPTEDNATSASAGRKPVWGSRGATPASSSAAGAPAAGSPPSRRVHNQSLTSTNSAVPSRAKAASPAPTDDSGLAWIDPSVNRL